MFDRQSVLIVLLVASLLPTVAVPAQGQVPRADLTIVKLEVLDAVYGGADATTVLATVRNNGPDATGVPAGVVHFRYGSAPLTGDTRSDQVFNVSQPLGAGEEVLVRVSWTPTSNQRGTGSVSAEVESSWDPSASNNRITVPVFVKDPSARVQLVDSESRSVFPGRTAFYRVNVTNVGNTEMTYAAVVAREPDGEDPEAADWRLPAGWTGRVEPPVVTLTPGERATLVVLLAAPASAIEGDTVDTRVNITPEVSVAEPPVQVLPTVDVTDQLPADFVRAVRVSPVEPSGYVDSGDEATSVRWLVENLGSEPDAFAFEASVLGPAADHAEMEAPPVVALNASQRALVEVLVHVTDEAAPGAASNLTLSASSINAAPEDDGAEGIFPFRVSGPVVVVDGATAPDPVYRDQGVASIEVALRNLGNRASAPGNATVMVVRSGFLVGSASARFSPVAPGAQATVQVPLDVSDLQGAYAIMAAVDVGSGVNLTTALGREVLANLMVRTAGLGVRPATPLSLRPGDYARFVQPPYLFEVQNLGNAREAVAVTIRTTHGWLEETRQLSIDPGSRAGVPIEFWIPKLPGVAREAVQVSVSLVNRSTVKATNETSIAITDTDAPRLLELGAPESVEALSEFQVNASFVDAVGVGKAWLTVRAPDGSEMSVPMERTQGDNFTADVRFDQLGTYGLRVHAQDGAERPNTFTSLDLQPVLSVFDRHPVLGLLEPRAGAIRSGQPIRLSIEDPSGLAAIHVSVRGEAVTLQGDKSIDTTGWLEGAYPIQVRAENRFGLTNETSFDVVVDNTAPIVRSFVVEPERPRPGDTITLRAGVDGEPAAVMARIVAEGQPTVTVPLLPRAQGFEGTTPLAAGTYQLTVEAEDAAGNVGTLEGPMELRVSAKTPWPSAGAAVALLLLAAALRTGGWRRR